MAGVKITIPGVGGQIEARKARIDAAVKFHWNLATAPPEKKVRWFSAGDLGKRLTKFSSV
jgi:hypothetical protein